MGKNNSFPLKLFLEQWLPRLIALSILGYLVYSLCFKQVAFSWLHITALLIVTALILAPMASRLRVSNLIDFNSKLDGLKQEQQETRTQLKELTNQISTTISMRSNPIQVMSFQGIRELLLADQPGKNQLASNTSTGKSEKDTKDAFLLTANRYCSMALPLLLITRTFQVTFNEHKFYTADMDIDQNKTRNETIKDLASSILGSDLTTIFTFPVSDEKNNKERLSSPQRL